MVEQAKKYKTLSSRLTLHHMVVSNLSQNELWNKYMIVCVCVCVCVFCHV